MDEPAAPPVVSILVVAYNSASVIGACLGSIPAGCSAYSYEILLVDNGDGSTEALVAANFPEVEIVPSRGNVGFAAGNNLLAARAQGTYLLLLNPDVELKPGALDNLLDAARADQTASAWGGVTLDREDQPDLGNTVRIPSLIEMGVRALGTSLGARTEPRGIDQDARVNVLSGSFVLFTRTAWDEAAGLDERYFLYCEEVDLFYRLGLRGHSFRRIGSATAYHDIGHGQALDPNRMLYRAAGTMQFARLHWSRQRQLAAFFLTWVGAWQRYLVGRLLGRWVPRYRIVGEGHRRIALQPNHWRYGYDPVRGLRARLR